MRTDISQRIEKILCETSVFIVFFVIRCCIPILGHEVMRLP